MIANIILYLIPLVFSVWILSSVFSVIARDSNDAPWFAKAVTGGIFIAGLLIWWWATITVVGPIF